MIFYPTKKRVIVNTKTDKSFRGILWKQRPGYLLLKNAELLEGSGKSVPIDGEVLVYRADVDFVQVLP